MESTTRTNGSHLRELISDAGIVSVYQPIVDLTDGETVGYEALARGPSGGSLESPAELFGAAAKEDLIPELDWACRIAAVEGALDGGVKPPLTLFVNTEPATAQVDLPIPFPDVFARALAELDILFEITERHLTADPARLLEMVASIRELGCGIALDDVGADKRSLALLPLLKPDVVKLDLRLVQQLPTVEHAHIAGVVQAQAEATGVVILAEGVEDEEHVFMAEALGATLAQGFRFGYPGALPASPSPPSRSSSPIKVQLRPPGDEQTPYEVVTSVRPARVGGAPLVLAISHQLEDLASALAQEGVLVGAFQSADRFRGRTRRRYAGLSKRLAFCAVIAAGMEREPEPFVRGGNLAARDPLVDEWTVVVLGPHVAAALSARDRGYDVPFEERTFDFAVSYDRTEVVEIARTLMARVTQPAPIE